MRKKSRRGMLLAASLILLAGKNCLLTAKAEDLLIEDVGQEAAVHEGADLDQLLAGEAEVQIETEAAEDWPLLEPARTEKLQEYLEQLTRMESPIGSDGELIVGRYIQEEMEGLGYTVSQQNFHEGFLNEAGVDAPGINIIAERGADAQKRHSDILIISTHYDSKTLPGEGDPLANDKSGAAVLLEMARILSYEETDTDICFLFLSGEEDGLYGSMNFVKDLEEEHRNRVAGVVYVEAVGYGTEYAYVLKTADGEENELGNLVREEALFSESGILDVSGEDTDAGDENRSGTKEQEDGFRQNWEYVKDEQTSQKSFADAGLTAVTVCQETEAAKQAGIDLEELRKITDLLAAAVGQIMSEATGSLL